MTSRRVLLYPADSHLQKQEQADMTHVNYGIVEHDRGKIAMKPVNLLILILTVVLIISICVPGYAESDDDRVVVKVDGSAITADDVSNYIRERPVARGAETMEEVFEAMLEEIITSEVLYNEAIRLKMEHDPEIRRAVRQMISQKLLNEQVVQPVLEREITEDELRQYYDEHIEEFVQAEKVRLADIFIAVPDDASSDLRDEKRRRAEEAFARVQGREGRFEFGTVIAEYSDKPDNYAMGDTGFFDSEGLPAGVDKEIVDIAFQLSRNGEIYNRVIETTKGFHIIMLVGKRSAMNRSFEDVKQTLEPRIQREELERKRNAYIHSLREKADVQVENPALEEIMEEFKKSFQGKQLKY